MTKILLAGFSFAIAACAGDLLLGRGEAKITPPPGMPMGGGFTIRIGAAPHDDLFCKAIVFEQDGTSAGLVSCDVESLHRPWILKARALIDKAGKIAGDNVMITATHNHAGPEMTPFVLAGATGETARIAQAYHDALPGKIAEAVSLAAANKTPARIWFARGEEHTISFNRRYVMKDGSVKTNPGQRNPEIVRAAGPIDPELSVLYFDAPDGKPLATIVNFALHTTAWGGKDFSADFPGVLATRLGEAKDPAMMTMFLQGCSGNINQVDVNSADKQSGSAATNRIATVLAAGVIKLYRKLEPVPMPATALRVRRQPVDLPVPEFTQAEIANARKVLAASRIGGKDAPKFLDTVHAFTVLNVMEVHGAKPIPTEVQAITFGDQAAISGLPAEIFTELGMALKRGSPFPKTMVAELANDMLDYIPNLKAYPEGSYEPTTARCVPGCGESLIQRATELLVNLHQQAIAR